MSGYEPKGQRMVHAKVVLKDGTTYPDAVIPYATPSEADIRVRNQYADNVIELELRSVTLHPTDQLYDEHTGKWHHKVRHGLQIIQVRAADIDSITEAS